MELVLASEEPPTPPLFGDLALVQVHGIEKKPELNEKIGVVLSFEGGADRRYTVKVSGSMVRLREDKLKEAPEGWEVSEDNDAIPELSAEEREAQAEAKKAAAAKALTDACNDENSLTKAIANAKTWGIDVQTAEATLKELQDARAKEQARREEEGRKRDEANIKFIESLPQGELTGSGRLVPTYSWVQVPAVASLPQGMEIWMLGGLKCARIPASWRIQIVAEGQVDSFRVDVGETSLVCDVLTGAASRFGWNVQEMQLQSDGKPINFDSKATVGSAGLFGLKLTARKMF
mmetsp:Transcript_98690/g.175703  ORF Transcript_98690/g.175703 Transcript_98690/m.175703 type:complete len:291 (+) Transcript_98690:35-907(+)|eukprot:CAMPEP_0197634154 /NCGR_PEP_ID=MMETSP1338-20131121/10340_1 /TAXON_ID=43686 ORGANISM="Pelagodinium beii, Strain RCC1491" /NCGR_SAMPLE_ID=MMETSP1338 /ASSEMBLY_ACC=CAM_ASM_000754 /LENGTH=290 /DNA_ID=CAMNT_0043205969 /DNA_START=35 /DNA_END=907 /DNA_ORIENTATION=-